MRYQDVLGVFGLFGLVGVTSSSVVQAQTTLDCLVEPDQQIDVSSPVRGIIHQVSVERGAYVREGTTLFRLRSELEKAQLELATARAEFSQRKLLRNDELVKNKLISMQENDDMATEAELAELELAETQVRMSQKRVRSPISGFVTEVYKLKGEFVDEDPVVKVVRVDPLKVEIVAPVAYLGQIQVGDEANIRLEAPKDSEHLAKVQVIDPIVDAASGTFRIRLSLPNPDNQITAGVKCEAVFQ